MCGAVAVEMVNFEHMTSTLEAVIEQAKALPDERQLELAEIVVRLIGEDARVPVIPF